MRCAAISEYTEPPNDSVGTLRRRSSGNSVSVRKRGSGALAGGAAGVLAARDVWGDCAATALCAEAPAPARGGVAASLLAADAALPAAAAFVGVCAGVCGFSCATGGDFAASAGVGVPLGSGTVAGAAATEDAASAGVALLCGVTCPATAERASSAASTAGSCDHQRHNAGNSTTTATAPPSAHIQARGPPGRESSVAGAGTGWVCSPGTRRLRSRSFSARRRASRMYDMAFLTRGCGGGSGPGGPRRRR